MQASENKTAPGQQQRNSQRPDLKAGLPHIAAGSTIYHKMFIAAVPLQHFVMPSHEFSCTAIACCFVGYVCNLKLLFDTHVSLD